MKFLHRGIHQGDLPLQALPRADQPLHPFLLDFTPGGMGKLRQNLVGHVKLRDGPVKIAEDDGLKITRGRFPGGVGCS